MAIESQSIHPGVMGGSRRFPKVNTCANSSMVKRYTRALVGINRHLETNPRDGVAQMRVSTIKHAIAGAK